RLMCAAISRMLTRHCMVAREKARVCCDTIVRAKYSAVSVWAKCVRSSPTQALVYLKRAVALDMCATPQLAQVALRMRARLLSEHGAAIITQLQSPTMAT